MSDDALPPLRDVIARFGLAAKKSLGQNFLFDLNLTRRIARAAAPLEGFTVIEVGPGPGGLTRALLMEGASHVIAIERDDRAIAALTVRQALLGDHDLAGVSSEFRSGRPEVVHRHWPRQLDCSCGDRARAPWAAHATMGA